MAVTDPTAIKYSDTRLRPCADRMAQCYNLAKTLKNQWNALGAVATALSLMQTALRSAADRFADTYDACYRAEKLWFLISGSTLFPNDTTQVFDNGSFTAQDPRRPPLTGAKVVACNDRLIQWQNWLLSATGSFTDTARNSAVKINNILQVSNGGPATLVSSDGQNFIDRCSDLITHYEATSNQNLNFILAVAVNPND